MNPYRWAQRGDVNAFFGLMLDNVAVMITLVVLISVASPAEACKDPDQIKFSSDFVMTRMIPGTALGVLLGDLVYTWLAFRLARRTGRTDVTAMPLGLDTPSTFGVAFLVLLPVLKDAYHTSKDHQQAMEFAWHVGLTLLVLVGIFKSAGAPLGNYLRRLVPRAGLLGSLVAIALALISFVPMLDAVARAPLVGMVSLLVILVTLVAHRPLPGRFPGALAAVLLGVAIYQLGRLLEDQLGWRLVPAAKDTSGKFLWQPTAFWPFGGQSLSYWRAVLVEALDKLPVIFPFALATVVGGIDCTESAAAAGDEYDTGSILLTEGLVSLLAGLLGGVIQTTPYIGHPAYKKMGGRAAYTLATALFIGTAGYLGWFTVLFRFLPEAVMFPILVFVGIEITAQSFQATPTRHYPALVLALIPTLAYLVALQVKTIFGPATVPATPDGRMLVQTLRCLGNGFLITGMLWAAVLAMILDGRLRPAAVYLAIAALCTLVGVMHSPLPDDRIDLPWNILKQVEKGPFQEVVRYQTPYHWAGAYGLMLVLLLVLDAIGLNGTGNGQTLSRSEEEKSLDPKGI